MSDPSHHDAKPPIQSTAGRQAQASVDPDPDPTLPDHPEADHADPRKGPALAKRTKRSSHSHSDPKLESDLRVEHDAQYILLLQDIKDDITRWAKARLWIIALVGAIVGGLGGYHVFEETMRSLVETRVNEQLTHLQAQSDKAVDKFAVDYQKSVDQLSLLKATNDVTVDTSRTAQATIKAAKDDLEALDKKSKQIESSIDDAEKK